MIFMADLEETLKFHGFTRTEARVYLKVLEMSQSKVGDLARVTGITRTQLYPLLDDMTKKGYVRQKGTKPVIYEAVSPKYLVKLLREHRKKQIYALSSLEAKLNIIKPIQKVHGASYNVYLIKGRVNIIRKLTELWQDVKKEVIRTDVFEREILIGSKKLVDINKEKSRNGVKTTVYLSIKHDNLHKIEDFYRLFRYATFGGFVKEQPYTTIIFDRKCVMIVFYDFHKKEYDSAFYFENPDMADAFASKSIAPIESYPLSGEVRTATIGGERALVIPPVLESISKEEQYKFGYSVGWYGIKPLKDLKPNMKTFLLMLQMQATMNGWGKARVIHIGDTEAVFILENCAVTPAFMKGNIAGFLSVLGEYIIKDRLVNQKKRYYEFNVKAK